MADNNKKDLLQKTELLFHPVRIRIIQALAMHNLTPLQLTEELVNVPQATLYRHLNKLVQAEILKVVAEHPVRGTVEKVYGLNQETLQAGSRDLLSASREELLELFTNFVLARIRDFAAYLQRDQINLVEDRISFRQAPLYLTNPEFMEMVAEFGQIFMKRLNNKPGPGRKPLMWTTITMPVPGPDEPPAGEENTGNGPEPDPE